MADESRNWPIRPDGHMLIEDHSEDGEWSGYAESGTNGGNLRWELEAVPIRVMKPGDRVLSQNEYNRISIGLENLEISAPLKLRGEIRKLREILDSKTPAELNAHDRGPADASCKPTPR